MKRDEILYLYIHLFNHVVNRGFIYSYTMMEGAIT